jgi:phosphatidylglycerol---prolipoprotein diacylglyceryl transferase
MEININPIALDLGYFKIHWYGLMYLLAFLLAYLVGSYRAGTLPDWTKEQVSDLVFYMALGAVLGGRLGYVFFYNFPEFMKDPLYLFKVWDGGMSFHGGLLGTVAAMFLFMRKTSKTFFNVADFATVIVPLGLAAGRFGNFINGELWGKPTDLPWGMIFIQGGQSIARHPSMLYEMVLEGFVLFAIMWWFVKKPRPLAAASGLWLMMYGMFRFAVEFVREPDRQLRYLAWDWLTMGQVLSTPMIIIGVALLVYAYRSQSKPIQ